MDDEYRYIAPSSAAASSAMKPTALGDRFLSRAVPPRALADSSSDQDSSDEVPRHHRVRRHTTIDLPKLRKDVDPDTENHPINPPIVWNAKVYHSRGEVRGDDLYLHQADFTYVDNRPIEFPLGVRHTQRPLGTKADIQEPSEWSSPVIAIEVLVEADFENDSRWEIVTSGRLDLFDLRYVSGRHLVVKSPFLLEGLSHLIQYYPSFHRMLLDTSKGREMRIQEPFAVLFHHFDAMEAMANDTPTATTRKSEHEGDTHPTDQTKVHMQHLIEFLRPIYTEIVLPCQKNLAESVPKIAFNMIWYLLKPGTDVYVRSHGSMYAAVVIDIRRTNDPSPNAWGGEDEGSWLVDLWRLETHGSILRRGFISVKVYAYTGLREVTLLSVCPVSIYDAHDSGEQRTQILSRSATFFKALLQGNLLADYNGPINDTDQYYTGKVVIDHRRGCMHSNIKWSISPVHDYSDRFREYDWIVINSDRSFYATQGTLKHSINHVIERAHTNDAIVRGNPETEKWLETVDVHEHQSTKIPDMDTSGAIVQQLSEHQLLLLCPHAQAYALRRKHWILISLDYVRESVPSEESVSNLIIAPEELKTIQALSNRQNSKTRHWSADFIEGKGSGQIILLHGPPGVGKTYTVESISEWLHRPLLALTVADIGTVETLVEGELMKWFDLAEAWNAVLLVDEADIFLERRQNRDLARNGLVSAFLRRMEYFKGLLFLTTNRVGQIDDAFISRVHVAIGYQALDEETRRKVWMGFFRKLVRERAGKIQIAPDAKKWVLDTTGATNLNGRDIRNALQTAITLAEFESEEDPDYDPSLVIVVTKTHFEKVLEMCNRFRSYVTSIRREDEKKRAQGRGDRNDYRGSSVPEMV